MKIILHLDRGGLPRKISLILAWPVGWLEFFCGSTWGYLLASRRLLLDRQTADILPRQTVDILPRQTSCHGWTLRDRLQPGPGLLDDWWPVSGGKSMNYSTRNVYWLSFEVNVWIFVCVCFFCVFFLNFSHNFVIPPGLWPWQQPD